MLPPGFSSRLIARANRPVAGYPWHIFSDGQATFATADGGWILVTGGSSAGGAAGGGSSGGSSEGGAAGGGSSGGSSEGGSSGGGSSGGSSGGRPGSGGSSPGTARKGAGGRGDADAPGLRLTVARRVSIGRLRSRGLTIEVELDEPAELIAALRTDDLRRVPGKGGSTPRPATITLDRRRLRARRAGRRLRLRIGAAEARRLRRGRPVIARVTVLARGADGLKRVATAPVRLR